MLGILQDRRRFRSLVFTIHTWLGLHLCLVFGILFLSGTLLLYSPELRQPLTGAAWIAPRGHAPEASFGTTYDRTMAALDGGRVFVISPPPRPWLGRPVAARDAQNRETILWTDPDSGAVLGATGTPVLRNTLRKLHDSLLMPVSPANIAVTALSLVLLTSVVTGLITYRRFWKGFRRLPAGSDPRQRQGAWHRLLAVWLAPFLLLVSLTGSVFFLNWMGVKAVVPQPPPPAERAWRLPEGFDGAALDRIVDIARAELPGAEITTVSLPGRRAEPFRISGRDPSAGPLRGAVTVTVDPVDLSVLGVARASQGNTMTFVKALAVMVHYGTWGGVVSLILWTGFGIGSAALLLTGARVYALRLRGGPDDAAASRSLLGAVWSGLGVFRWAYLLALAGAVGLNLMMLLR